MGVSTQPLGSDVYLTAIIRDKYLEELEKDEKVSLKKLIANFIEEYLSNKCVAPLE